MGKEEKLVESEVVRMKVVRRFRCFWMCPNCKLGNTESYYDAPGRAKVECDFCGKIYIAER